MRQLDAFQNLDLVVLAPAKKSRRVFTGAVPRKDRRRIEWGNKECRRGVRLMVFEIVKFEFTRPKMLAKPLRMFKHP